MGESHEIPNLDCHLHPEMLGILTIDMGGKVHFHAHVDKATFTAMLSDVVDLLRRELLTEAA